MKIDTIYHSKESRRKECKGDKPEKRFSKDPIHHPFLLEREYVRALNSTKIDRMLAKPFITALSHHREGINKLVKSYSSTIFGSSSYDNKVILWDLVSKDIVFEKQFESTINGIGLDTGNNLYVSQNKTVHMYHTEGIIGNRSIADNDTLGIGCGLADDDVCNAPESYKIDSIVTTLDCLDDNQICIGGSNNLSIFDINRHTPKNSYEMDNVSTVKFNRSFKYILGALSSMSINLFDNRSSKDFLSVDMSGSNCMCFNPQRGFLFVTGNENGNGYLHDIRNTEKPIETYRGHTNAIVSISFSPNGREIATGSFDKTIRIFNINERKSRDCYYNDRMQIVHGVEFSNDGEFIVSGSDDSSLRLWKANSSRKVGPVSRIEKESMEYTNALKDKFRNVGEVSRISRHRFLNKEIKEEARIKHEMYEGSVRRAKKKEKEREFQEKYKIESESEY